MRKSIRKLTAASILIGLLNATGFAAPTPTASEQAQMRQGYNDSGVQLNRTREYLERQRVAQQIAEDRQKQAAKVEKEKQEENLEGSEIKFQLTELTTDTSEILTQDEIDAITQKYLNTEITLADLYEIVNEINKVYEEKGYLTCRAYLAPQTIKNGVVHISLIEGKTSEVILVGNKDTKDSYIKDRLAIKPNEISNINKLNEDLLRFNGTNDVQLRISMRAGKEPGTTEYIISAYEPKRTNFNVYVDTLGSDTTGEWREGLFYTNRSFSGHRDNLTLSTLWSKGTQSFSAMYTTPVGHSGTKLGLSYSSNSIEVIDGAMKPFDVKGHSNMYGISLTQPLRITEKLRTEAALEYTHQNSQTDFLGSNWIDDTTNAWTASYAMTNYGDSSVVYQKHSYRIGGTKNALGDTTDFNKYLFNGIYQKAYKHGQMLSGRLDAQRSSKNYLSTGEQFYIGGMYSVRGYKESLLGGDHGYAASIEYSVPITKDHTASIFTFFDYGSVFGDSALDDHILAGTGLGVRATIDKNIYTSLVLGVPLQRDLNGTEVSKTRLHFMLNGQF